MGVVRSLSRTALLILLAAGSAAITHSSLDYFFGDEVAAFIIEKLPLPLESVWLAALHVHVIAAALAFPGCLLAQSQTLLRHFPRAHRIIGRVTAVIALGALVPTGFYMALFAKAGLLSSLGFILLGVLMTAALVRGVLAARAGEHVEHRRMMWHVVALMSVAVWSRTLLIIFDRLSVDPDVAYLLSLWVPLLGGVAVVELLFHLPLVSRRDHAPLPRARPAALVVLDHHPRRGT